MNAKSLTRKLVCYASAALIAGLTAMEAQPPGRPPNGPPPPQGPAAQAQAKPIAGLTPAEMALFQQGLAKFTNTEAVSDGFGPRFNSDSCSSCHAAPATGGSSPVVNPQIAAASRMGARNVLPPFVQANGPVHVVRFKRDAAGNPDGGVHDLFVITGRSDAPPGCKITQPDFSDPTNQSLRIPTPVFGAGLIESISDSTLRANLFANQARNQQLGIAGRFNTNGNDGTITRFGWKAQNKSLTIFSGEAYNVEMGVTNELFPQEREEDAICANNGTPEDHLGIPSNTPSDITLFTYFMRFLAPPPAPQLTPSAARGQALFASVGCVACHTPSLATGTSSTAALTNQTAGLYSDLAIHKMGAALDDGVSQGLAQGNEWRTAPLWGLGGRLFFLHDGRTNDLNQAIQLHDSAGSEAHQVIGNYNALTGPQRQDLINFLLAL